MTGEEKRKILKEEYKKELQARKEFKEKAESLRKLKNINNALTDMTGALNDDSDDWVQKIDSETAFMEAKIEMAMDAESTLDREIKEREQAVQMEKLTAKNLVEQMKREMGLLPEVEETADPEVPAEDAPESAETEKGAGTAKKTMGDF
jgi:hypothetical protein